MLELFLCAVFTILPDYLLRRYVQGKQIGREITIFSVWYELRWGITMCLILTVSLITAIFLLSPVHQIRHVRLPNCHCTTGDQRSGE